MTADKLLVYTAQSKQYFYCKDAVCEYVFRQDAVPLNPFRVFGYFLGDRVDRDAVREANRHLISISDEVWVFGQTLADGVVIEITQAMQKNKPLRFFSISASAGEIEPIRPHSLDFEVEVLANSGLEKPRMLADLLQGQAEQVVAALGRRRELYGS